MRWNAGETQHFPQPSCSFPGYWHCPPPFWESQPDSLTLIAPLAAACWLAARRRYRLILRPDTLEQITWRGRTVISLRNTTVEIRIPAGIRAARTAHLPCLCLRREGQVVFSLPTYTLRSRDQRAMAEFFRRSTDLPLRHISFLT